MENTEQYHAFNEEKISILQLLASQCAISISNARLYNDISFLKSNLEKEIQERTESLQRSMELTNEAITEMTLYAERNRIAQEIHDVVGHTLTSTILQIEAGRRLMSKNLDGASTRFKEAQDLIRHSLNEIRNSVHMLKEDQYYDVNQSLLQLIDETIRNTEIEITHKIDDLSDVPQIMKKLLYHALQEGLTNGLKHGKSSYFKFELIKNGNQLSFNLQDHGQCPEEIVVGFGVKMMRERVEQLQGTLKIGRNSFGGCTLQIELPIFMKQEG